MVALVSDNDGAVLCYKGQKGDYDGHVGPETKCEGGEVCEGGGEEGEGIGKPMTPETSCEDK